jgi:putative nucleotidyltransferase with HDIG domain
MSAPLPLQMVCEMARNIPCSPTILPQLMKVLNDPNSGMADVEKIINRDPGLASSTLSLANSAYFTGGMKCETLRDALTRLGRKEVYRYTVSSVAGRWLNQEVSGYGWQPGDLSRHSVSVGLASEILARRMGKVDPDLAFTAGLLHDVGKLALAYSCADMFEDIRKLQAEEGCPWRMAEKEYLGYDHTDVGGTLLMNWSYPTSLVEVVVYYPRPSNAAVEFRPLVATVHAAKHLALAFGLGVGEEGFTTELDEPALKDLGITQDIAEECLPLVLVESEKMLGACLTIGKWTL